MNKIESWFLKRIFKREVKQGHHYRRIVDLYSMITEAARAEFTEDNIPTLNQFLIDAHKDSLD